MLSVCVTLLPSFHHSGVPHIGGAILVSGIRVAQLAHSANAGVLCCIALHCIALCKDDDDDDDHDCIALHCIALCKDDDDDCIALPDLLAMSAAPAFSAISSSQRQA
jgi:hypothetical protein